MSAPDHTDPACHDTAPGGEADKPTAGAEMVALETLTRVAWTAEAETRYGPDPAKWRFRCPVCKVETSVQQWRDAGAPEGAVAFSCVGRFQPGEPGKAFGKGKTKQPCDYAGGGLFRLNPVGVCDENNRVHHVFDFADNPLARATGPTPADAGRMQDGEAGRG